MAEIHIETPARPQGVDSWLVLGIDPSMSRTGYAFMNVLPTPTGNVTEATWLDIGSIKGKADTPEWVRCKLYAEHMRQGLYQDFPNRGLIICMEYPTPTNTFLVQLNRIIHLVFFQHPEVIHYKPIKFLVLNASTMRSVMGLKKRGNNKAENILRSYDYVDREDFPGIDSDSCDGVLMAMFGRYAASVMMGYSKEVPAKFLNALCSAELEIKRKGRPTQYTVTKGLLHRPEYWYEYQQQQHTVLHKDARIPTGKKLEPETYLT